MERKSFVILLSLLVGASAAFAAEVYKTKYNPQTGRPDWVHDLTASGVYSTDNPPPTADINWDDPATITAVQNSIGWTKGTGTVYTSTLSDNVGIGTSAPGGKLVVYGGNVGIGTATPKYGLHVHNKTLEVDDPNEDNYVYLNPEGQSYSISLYASDLSKNWYFDIADYYATMHSKNANDWLLSKESEQTQSVDIAAIDYNSVSVAGFGATPVVVDESFIIYANTAVSTTEEGQTAKITDAYGVYLNTDIVRYNSNSSVPAITNSYDIFVNNSDVQSGNRYPIRATNKYNIFIQDYTDGSYPTRPTGLSYAIYSANTSASFFAGNLGIGSSVPTQKLDVVGTVKATRFEGDGSGLTGITGTGSSLWASGAIGINTTAPVGIGSAAPRAALDVNGNVYGTFIGNVTGTASTATAVADADKGDVTISSGAWAVEDDSHAHTTTTISGIDISADTNLAGTANEITLTDDTLSLHSAITRDSEWTGLDFLVGTATGTLSGEIAVGTTPGGELGGTWASPTLDDGVTVANWVLTTPNVGIATATSINKVTITAPASGSTLTIADGKTLTVTNTVNLNTMTDGKWCKYTASGTVLNCDQNEPSGSNYWLSGATGIGTTGAVGVGSSSPQYKLEVQGNVGIGTGTFNAANFLRVNGNVGIGTTAQSQTFEVFGAGAFVGTGDTVFNGNVGIGTSAPGRALAVNGNLSVGVGTTGAGYVLCIKSAVGTNAVIGYCTSTYSGGVCTCN